MKRYIKPMATEEGFALSEMIAASQPNVFIDPEETVEAGEVDSKRRYDGDMLEDTNGWSDGLW